MSARWIRIPTLSFLAQLYLLSSSTHPRPADAAVPPGYALVWSDEFNGTTLDNTKWGNYQPGMVRRNAINTPAAVSVGGGFLTMRTYTELLNGTPQHYTGMLQSGQSLATTDCAVPNEVVPPGDKYLPRYGYIEARIDFDGQSGMWHSFFLNTPRNLLPGPRDEHDRGMELDIVEHKKMQGNTDVSSQAPSAIHWMTEASPYCPNASNFWHGGGVPHSGNGSLATGFHTYGMEWTPDFIKMYYDSILVFTVNNSTQGHPLCPNGSTCLADPCVPGGGQSTCVIAPVPHVNEHLILAGEVPPPGQDTFNAYGNAPPLPFGFGPLGDPTNPKMRIDYIRHYQMGPTALTATPLSFSQIQLQWTDNSDPESGFKIERSPDGVNNFTEVTTVAADTVAGDVHTYVDMGLDSETRYYYRVGALIGGGVAYSAVANAFTDNTPPAAITNLALPSLGKKTMAVSWTAPGDDGTGESVLEYDLRRSTSQITAANFSSATRITTATPQVAGHPECQVVPGLTGCTTYYFAIKSRDDGGNWSAISNLPHATTICTGNPTAQCVAPPSDVTPPAAVMNLTVSVSGSMGKAVSWTAPGDDGNTGTASEYDLRYSTSVITSANFSSASRAIISAPQPAGSPECAIVMGLSSCTTYYFALKTRDEWGNWSLISNLPNAATECQVNHLPDCPGGLAAAQTLGNGAAPQNDDSRLSFSAPFPNPAHGATSFRIFVPAGSRGARLRVGVFDIAGRRVRSLVDRAASAGPAQIDWNLRDDSGRRVASGLYMVGVNIADTRKTFTLVVGQ